MKILISIATLAGLTSLSINAAIHKSVLAAPAEAKLTSAQIQQLRSLGIEIAVPTYIPNRFRVDKVKVQPCPLGVVAFALNILLPTGDQTILALRSSPLAAA